MSKYYSMQDIICSNKNNGQHFFDGSSMRFFRSRLCPSTVKTVTENGQDKTLFVTSEQFDWKSPRLFTVRCWNWATKRMDTVSDFQGFETRAQAVGFINRYIKKVGANV